jgi:hypothetical protein
MGGCWVPGPYVSFTTSPGQIETLAGMRRGKRGAQTLTVIDPNERIRNGLPVLNIAAEMRHYDIPDPYGGSNDYYIDHYVCLWQVTGAEIVGHWDWSRLAENEHWYDEIIIPAFERLTATTSTSTNGRLEVRGAERYGTKDMDLLQRIFSNLFGKKQLH